MHALAQLSPSDDAALVRSVLGGDEAAFEAAMLSAFRFASTPSDAGTCC